VHRGAEREWKVHVAAGAGGLLLRKLAVDPSPLVVALVLGPMMEKTLRQSLFLSRGSVLELVSRPLTATLLLLGALALFAPPLIALVRRRRADFRAPVV
jgi:putative tricarboxylic transport membrane protein